MCGFKKNENIFKVFVFLIVGFRNGIWYIEYKDFNWIFVFCILNINIKLLE